MQFRLSRLAYAVVVFLVMPYMVLGGMSALKSGAILPESGGWLLAVATYVVFIAASLARIADMHVRYCKAAFWVFVGTLFFPPVAFALIPAFVYFYKTGAAGESVLDAMRGRGTVEF